VSDFPAHHACSKGESWLLDPDNFAVLPNGVIILQHNPGPPMGVRTKANALTRY
jgi:hypothetical protein